MIVPYAVPLSIRQSGQLFKMANTYPNRYTFLTGSSTVQVQVKPAGKIT